MLKRKWPGTGNKNALLHLETDLNNEQTRSHAYLLSGPKNIGKWRIAKTMAGIFQCPQNYCETCKICRQIQNSTHADTKELPDDGEVIKISIVRDLVNKIAITPQAAKKVILIQNIERMNLEAANAFLKTLEEPPEDTIFIATTSNKHQLPETVISRMRVYNFNRPEKEEVLEELANIYPNVNRDVIEEALKISLNCLETSKNLLNNHEELFEKKRAYNEIVRLLEDVNLYNCFSKIEEFVKELDNADYFLNVLEFVAREKLLSKIDENNSNYDGFVYVIEEIGKIRQLLKNNINVKLLLEKMFVNFYHKKTPL